MLTIENYDITDVLHEGKFYNIYHATRLKDKTSVIIKIHSHKIPDNKQYYELLHDFEIGKKFNHPHIVQYYALEKVEHRLALIMEDFDGSPIVKQIPKGGFDLPDFLKISLQLVNAIEIIHQQSIIHQNINPNNIIINLHRNQIKIVDFAYASSLNYENALPVSFDLKIANLAYISPEQTGRMNRSIDYRTDLYSLGIVLYQLLFGQLPFTSKEPLELIHCHLAKNIEYPKTKKTKPIVILHIIEKLLAKDADDRYQSTYGLKLDLQKCLEQLYKKKLIDDFVIGKADVYNQFKINQKLYGRKKEIQQLLNTFHQISEGIIDKAIMLVHGYSGTGKTSLIKEIEKFLDPTVVNFNAGKCQQFEHGIPYAPFVQAFKQLIGKILTEKDEIIAEWRSKLLAVLGNSGQIMIQIIPELEIIIGAQPPVSELTPIENQLRFQHVLSNFIAACAQQDYPLIIFIDDLHWANPSTLNLIKLIAEHPGINYLFIIGTYRDNEINEHHPLDTLIKDMYKQSNITDIALESFTLTQVKKLISDTLHIKEKEADSLTTLVYAKTHGNPFFTIQFLNTLYKEKLIIFDVETRKWHWNLIKIKELNITDNIIDLMLTKIRQLPITTQTILSQAAISGYQFDIETLALINNIMPTEIVQLLWPAVQAGLILSINEDNHTAKNHQHSFQFLHDKIQQAIALSIESEKLKLLHLQIGNQLLEKTPLDMLEEKIFDIVGHLNEAQELIKKQAEKVRLAELNLTVAKKVKASTAYSAAVYNLQVGIKLLPKHAWKSHYKLMFNLHKELSECHYLLGEFAKAEKIYVLIIENAATVLDKISVYFIKKNQMELQGRYQEAVNILLEGLTFFDIYLPNDENQSQELIYHELQHVNLNLKGRKIKDLANAKEINNPQIIATIQLLIELISSCYLLKMHSLAIVASCKATNLCLQHGNCEITSAAYTYYASFIGLLTKNYTQAYEFGKVSIKLSQQYNNFSLRCKTYFIFGFSIQIWRKPLKASFSYLEQSYKFGIESGNLSDANYTIDQILGYRFMQGIELLTIYDLSKPYFTYLKHTHFQIYLANMASAKPIRKLMNIYDPYDEDNIPVAYLENNYFAVCYYYGNMVSAYYLNEKEDQLIYAKQLAIIDPVRWMGNYKVVEIQLFIALIYLATYATATPIEKQEYLAFVENVQSQMEIWVMNCAANNLHKSLLIKAEKARVQVNPPQEIKAWYQQAIEAARQYGFIQYEALSNELCANYCWQIADETSAHYHIREAYELYHRWGAKVKTQLLEDAYPWLLNIKNSVLASFLKPQAFDSNILMKVAGSIANQTDLKKLFVTILQPILKYAGAQYGSIILMQNDGHLIVKAEYKINDTTLTSAQNVPIETWKNGPYSVVQYVKKTKFPVLLEEATQNSLFKSDKYIIKNQIKSILCIPMLRQNKLKGLLYLDNKDILHSFTQSHLEVLQILATQIAISLEANFGEDSDNTLRKDAYNDFKGVNKLTSPPNNLSQLKINHISDKYNAVEELNNSIENYIKNLSHDPIARQTKLQVFHNITGIIITLTKQQSRCLLLLMQGNSAKNIARAMNLSYRTVEHYLEKIRQKLGCKTNKEILSFYGNQLITNKKQLLSIEEN